VDKRIQTQLPTKSKSRRQSLAVGFQSKIQSWYFMLSIVTKPHITSSMYYLIGMTAMLGMYWEGSGQILLLVDR
jgi:hypothetical protein